MGLSSALIMIIIYIVLRLGRLEIGRRYAERRINFAILYQWFKRSAYSRALARIRQYFLSLATDERSRLRRG